MSIKKKRIPPMEGLEKEMMTYFLNQLRESKGLITILDQVAGINGKWLKPDAPRNIDASKILRIILIKTAFQTDEELFRDVTNLTNRIRVLIVERNIDIHKKKKKH